MRRLWCGKTSLLQEETSNRTRLYGGWPAAVARCMPSFPPICSKTLGWHVWICSGFQKKKIKSCFKNMKLELGCEKQQLSVD